MTPPSHHLIFAQVGLIKSWGAWGLRGVCGPGNRVKSWKLIGDEAPKVQSRHCLGDVTPPIPPIPPVAPFKSLLGTEAGNGEKVSIFPVFV